MNAKNRLLGKPLFLLIVLGLFTVSGVVFAANIGNEINTAEEHAGFAAHAKNVENTHLHLHHVVNCMVGTKGSGFDTKVAYPCKGQGNGVMNDLTKSSTDKAILQQALTLAKTGTEISAYRPAHDVALAVRDLLQTAAKDQAKQNKM